MDVAVLRGEVPKIVSGYGTGDGYGYRCGYGYGSGSGSGYDLLACLPSAVPVTAEHLKRGNACNAAVQAFEKAFPNGGTWPDDIAKAEAAGLDVNWCRKFGLLRPVTEGGSHE